ncbi:esterase [Variovorax sp. PCZ-1]|uniref:esterase n=1 Tax=Variovorax sp. PCZ-1 TaxID=2835533 RepID=UPI001BCD2B4E|nr:esterase [Variovorax sp. PCZ-1]MBS7806704.1 esterase [Variovorax sp. PCZ-1]
MKQAFKLAFSAIAAASAALLTGCASTGGMQVADVGSFHVGGKQVALSGLPEKELRFTPSSPPIKVNPNGEFEVEQMYVQYVKLAAPKAKFPLLMWHGGGLTGVTYETKPDGGEGWQMAFLKNGHDVYVSDATERGRASWARYPEIFSSEPFFRAKKEGWELFRIGAVDSYNADPTKRTAFAGTQFPTGSFDQFGKQFVPRWATNNAPTQASYDAYVQRVCPCVILVHSQGSTFAFEAARKYPNLIKGVVAVEPSGGLNAAQVDISSMKAVPHLFVWGDFIDQNPTWKNAVLPPVQRFADALKAQGGVVDTMDLPKMGIKGNSHMIMMDMNSGQVADLIQGWLAKQGLMK